jgi:hypothetical protein
MFCGLRLARIKGTLKTSSSGCNFGERNSFRSFPEAQICQGDRVPETRLWLNEIPAETQQFGAENQRQCSQVEDFPRW